MHPQSADQQQRRARAAVHDLAYRTAHVDVHDVGTKLLDRTARGVEPTVPGRIAIRCGASVFGDLRDAIEQIEQLVRISREFGRDIATAQQAREICKIGVFYDTADEAERQAKIISEWSGLNEEAILKMLKSGSVETDFSLTSKLNGLIKEEQKKADEIKKLSADLYSYIEELKLELKKESGLVVKDGVEDFKPDNLDAATRLMDKNGKGKELYEKLGTYRKAILAHSSG